MSGRPIKRTLRRRQRQDQAMVEPLVIPCVVVVRDEFADGATPRWCTDPVPSVSHDRPTGHRGDGR